MRRYIVLAALAVFVALAIAATGHTRVQNGTPVNGRLSVHPVLSSAHHVAASALRAHVATTVLRVQTHAASSHARMFWVHHNQP